MIRPCGQCPFINLAANTSQKYTGAGNRIRIPNAGELPMKCWEAGRMFRRVVLLFLVLGIGAISELFPVPGLAGPPGAGFPDVPPGSAAAPAVSWLSSHGVVKGFPDGEFRPAQPVARAEFVSLLARLLHPQLGGGVRPPAFADLHPGFWADREISLAAARGWVKGVPAGRRILFLL